MRAVARAVAEECGGLLADLCTAQLIATDGGAKAERDWFCLADRWLGIDCLVDDDAGVDGPATQCSCLCLFTRGMIRFGLPELVIDQAACSYDLAATNLLRGLAVRLLTQLWRTPTRELRIDDLTVIEPADMWGYWGAEPVFGQSIPIKLADFSKLGLPGGRGYLEIQPPPDFGGTRVQWCRRLHDHGLGEVAGCPPANPPYRFDLRAPLSRNARASRPVRPTDRY